MEIKGRVWKFGDDIDTGQLAPGGYLNVEDYSQFCLVNMRPEFVKQVQPGDIIVAGKNFGCGSSRETAVCSLLHLQVGAVVAGFFARIFFRNAVNLGLPVTECSEVNKIQDGDMISVRPLQGEIENFTRDEVYKGLVLPEHMLEIIQAGGLVPYLEKQLEMGKY